VQRDIERLRDSLDLFPGYGAIVDKLYIPSAPNAPDFRLAQLSLPSDVSLQRLSPLPRITHWESTI